MLIGYARCSTDTRDLTAQEDGVTALRRPVFTGQNADS